jgi:hypothetical protein
MKRQVNNLLFLYTFVLALMLGRIDYMQFGRSLLANIDSKLSKPHKEGKIIVVQTTQRALPNVAFISAHQSFMRGEYINKGYITQRVGVPAGYYQHRVKAPTTNYGRDGP